MNVDVLLYFPKLCPSFVGITLCQFSKYKNQSLGCIHFCYKFKLIFYPIAWNSTTHLTLMCTMNLRSKHKFFWTCAHVPLFPIRTSNSDWWLKTDPLCLLIPHNSILKVLYKSMIYGIHSIYRLVIDLNLLMNDNIIFYNKFSSNYFCIHSHAPDRTAAIFFVLLSGSNNQSKNYESEFL